MTSGYRLRAATTADLPVMADHRRRMLIDMGTADDEKMAAMLVRFVPWAKQRMECGECFTWFALSESGGDVAAGAAVWMKPLLPGTASERETLPYVFNVFCEPGHRRRGLARMLMAEIVAWAKAEGQEIMDLHASDEGRPLYTSMGFEATREMRLDLS